jgi:hypothetical protein
MDGSNNIFNNGQLNQNFRVATQGGANSLYVEGSSGKVGIGTNSPTSTFQVNGSMGTTMVSKSANYTATISDNTINCTTSGITITLPTAVGIDGREYTIINSTSGNVTVATTSSQTIGNFTTATTYTLASDKSVTVKSDNANYKVKMSN